MENILNEIKAERQRQKDLAFDGDTEAFDKTNSESDWVAYISAYAGRAPSRVFRNGVEGEKFRDNMVKVAALAVAAIEASDKGYV